MSTKSEFDRLRMRAKPDGNPVMEQNWDKILFLHWPVDPQLMRARIPAHLEVDLFEDKAWIGITPFRVTELRLMSLPPIPGLDSFNEINVRTYVHHNGKPGIWFFSLDASKLIPVIAARLFYQVPYFSAEIDFQQAENDFSVEMTRTTNRNVRFKARWKKGTRLRDPDAESLAFFLVERYCFFAELGNSLMMTRVYHQPWILDEAIVGSYESSLIGSLGLPEPVGEPLAHFSEGVTTQIWDPRRDH
jgi:uncharacterized protein YqjF (DUF2071 family)